MLALDRRVLPPSCSHDKQASEPPRERTHIFRVWELAVLAVDDIVRSVSCSTPPLSR